jgi:hypothetical protein
MIRSYNDSDYDQLKALYQHTEWYGGVFDEARDGRERLASVIQNDPQAILVFEEDSLVKATISIIEDGRVAMLYRFVVAPEDSEIAKQLYDRAIETLKSRGHTQILVYSAINSPTLDSRYTKLGMARGSDYACFWADI